MKQYSRQRGVGLIEVLIAVLVIGVAVAAISKFQGKMLKASSQTSHREVALKLVQAKMDDLRSFGIDDDAGFNFEDIDNNLGGRADQLLAGSVAFDHRSFNLDWQVTDYAYVNGAFVTPVPSGADIARKQVVVNVRWNDVRTQPGNDGEPEPIIRVLSMTHYLSPTLFDTGSPSSGGGDAGSDSGPQVNYQEYLAPDVIDIELGDNKKRETSKPIPEVDASDDIVMVQFDTVNFLFNDESDQNDRLTQEDMVTVSCNCTKQSAQAESANPIQLEWTNDDALYWTKPESTTKPAGQAIQQGDSQMEELCNRCCTGHFDEESGGSELASDRLESHYSYDAKRWGNTRYLSERLSDGSYRFTQASSDQEYTEACRFMRFNGFYELMPDWQQVHLELMSRDFLDQSDHEVQYQQLVTDVLEDFDDSSEFFQVNPGAYQFVYGSGSGAFPQQQISIESSSGSTQFIARAIYSDPIETIRGEKLTVPLASYPFYEVNTTLLADWSLYVCNSSDSAPGNGCQPCTADNDEYHCEGGVSLSNQRVAGTHKPAVDDQYYSGYYSRGELSYHADSSGYFLVTVASRKSNSGLTGVGPLSPYDEATTFESTMMVKLGNETSSVNVGGRIYCAQAKLTGNPKTFQKWDNCNGAAFESVTVTTSDQQTCSVTEPKGNSTGRFDCNLPSAWESADEQIMFSADNTRFDVSDAGQFSPGIITSEMVRVRNVDEKGRFCVAMIVGDIPAGADTLLSCDYQQGLLWSQ